MKKNRIIPFLPVIFVFVQTVLLVALDYTFLGVYHVAMYTLSLLLLAVVSGGTAFFYGVLRGESKKRKIIRTVCSVALCPGITPGLVMLFLNVIWIIPKEITSYVYLITTILYFVGYFILQTVALGKKVKKSYTIVVAVVTVFLFLGQIFLPVLTYLQMNYKAPTVLLHQSSGSEKEELIQADYYIATDGKDTNSGSLEAPFATFARAKEAIKTIDKESRTGITVAVKAGEYRFENLTFEEEDGGTENCPVTYCAYGDGEVILNGGITLDPQYRTDIPSETKQRLKGSVQNNILCYDLAEQGITSEMLGKIYTIGSYNTADKYDGDYVGGIYCELFYNDMRMNLARYPDSGYLKTGTVKEMGEGLESDGSVTKNPNWDTLRNPKGDTYYLSDELNKRISSWQNLDEVWMYGFWKYTWADASTPIGNYNRTEKTITTKFVSLYGAVKNAPYYFFNVLEELDAPGEWYLDREKCLLYLYAPDNGENAVIDLSLTERELLTVRCDYLTLRGFTVKGARGNGITAEGNHITVDGCLIKNVSENAMDITGTNNTASRNEITHTGKGGIMLSGGDRETLSSGNNVVENNLIHDWSEIYQTYQVGVRLKGVGNLCSHNEFYHSPHTAILYEGNNHIIEYNNIHDVCLLSDDAGAIYSGRKWTWYGNIIRYNAVYNLGSDGHTPSGIYMDDDLSGQTIYGNILVNVPGNALQLGGGRDLLVKNNVIVNCNVAISYDDRARKGALEGGWFDHAVENGEMWQDLYDSPWQTDIWQKAFPAYQNYSSDFSDPDNPNLVVNPAYSQINNNLILSWRLSIGTINATCYRFSDISDNYCGGMTKTSLFENYAQGDYRIRTEKISSLLPDFLPIPVEQIGRE